MIKRTWENLENRYTVYTDDGRYVLISTGSYSTACEYDRYARHRITPQTLTRFQRYVKLHRKYWQEDLAEDLELYKQRKQQERTHTHD